VLACSSSSAPSPTPHAQSPATSASTPSASAAPRTASPEDVAALYARTAGVAPRASHFPAGVAAALSLLVRPLHPGLSRMLRLVSLPDDAFSERFESSVDFERELGVRMTTLEEFVHRQVERAGRTA